MSAGRPTGGWSGILEPGGRIGPYRLLLQLGSGGSSRVFLAERDDPELPLQVALKVLRADRSAKRRFEHERRVSAKLEHPHIARLLDSGETSDGAFYLAKEYVDGLQIDQYCAGEDLGIDDRVRLVITVCRAVSYAHQRLIVHQDLKPANIWLTTEGAVKLLDFGIAEDLAVSERGDELTGRQWRGLTPAYAAPEQLSASGFSTAVDVYSLGVVLYELLVADLPHELEGLSDAELEARVCRRDAIPATRRLRERPAAADHRLPPEVRAKSRASRRVPKDLEAILLTAIARDPALRYDSVADFSADLSRYLDGLPVIARAPTMAYRARKWVGRHRAASVSVSAFLLTIAVLTGLLWRQSVRLEAQRDRARIEKDRATETFRFLETMLTEADPDGRRGNRLTVEELLLDGERRIEADITDATVQGQLLQVFSDAHYHFGDPRKALELMERALDVLRPVYGADNPILAHIYLNMGLAETNIDAYQRAELHIRMGRALLSLLPEGDPNIARGDYLAGYWHYRNGNLDQAGRLLEGAVERLTADWGSDHPWVVEAANTLALVWLDQGNYLGAVHLYSKELELRRQQQEPPTRILSAMNFLGASQYLAGRFEDAETTLSDTLPMLEQVGEDLLISGPITAITALNLLELGKLEQAESVARRSFEIRRRLFPAKSRHIGFAWRVRGDVWAAQGRIDEAEDAYEQSIEILDRALAPGHPFRADPIAGLANLWVDTGRVQQALPLLRRALKLRREGLGPTHHQVATSYLDLALGLQRSGEPGHRAEIAELWAAGEAILKAAPRDDRALRRIRSAVEALARSGLTSE